MTDTPRKKKIPVDKLNALIDIRTQLDTKIKDLEAKSKALGSRRRKAEDIISRYINKDDGEQSHTVDGMMCYASISDFYRIQAALRDDTNRWVLQPFADFMAQGGGDIEAAYAEALSRLDLFKNEVNKKYVDQYRIDNGAEIVVTGKNTRRIDFGDLPDGVNMHREDIPNFRKVAKK